MRQVQAMHSQHKICANPDAPNEAGRFPIAMHYLGQLDPEKVFLNGVTGDYCSDFLLMPKKCWPRLVRFLAGADV